MAIGRVVRGSLIVLTIVSGCANDRATDGAAPTTTTARTTLPIPTTTLPDLTASAGLAASIRQFREDEVVDRIQIELVRGLDAAPPVRVASVRLHWPGFADVAPTGHEVTVAPGQRVDVPVPKGPVQGCLEEHEPPSYARGSVDVGLADGRHVTAPLLADAQVALDNVWNKACMTEVVTRKVSLSYSSPWVRSDPGGVPTATADLIVTRKSGAGLLGVAGVDGSVHLVVSSAVPLPQMSEEGRTTFRLPLVVTGAGRCDGHAMSDSKKTYDFQFRLLDGDVALPGIELSVPEADRPVLSKVITDTCAGDHSR